MSEPSRRRIRRVIGLATCALVVTAVAANAQPSDGFVPGSGNASSQVLAVVPRVGNAAIPATAGLATSAFRGTSGVAESTTLDLGLLGYLLTLSICGSDPFITADQLPAPLHVDSNSGDSAQARDKAGNNGAWAGHEQAEARPGTFASADTSPAGIDLSGLVAIGSSTAHSETELVPGSQRRSFAVSRIGSLSFVGGQVRLDDLEWRAEQITGADGAVTKAEGTFTVGHVILAGVPLPTADAAQLDAAIAAVNAALSPVLMTLQRPTLSLSDDGRVEVTPLRLELSGGATGRALLAPVVGSDSGSQIRHQIGNTLLFGGCKPDTKGTPLQQLGGGGVTVLDVLIGALQGNGGLGLELGGAAAATDAKVFDSAFTAPSSARKPAPTTTTTEEPDENPGAGSRRASETAAPQRGSSNETAIAGPTSTTCGTTHEHGSPGCSTGQPGLVLLLAGITAAALGAGDVVRSRRRKVRPQEATVS